MSTDERGHFLRYWLAKGCNLVATHRREDDMTDPTPVTESGIRQYDHLPAPLRVIGWGPFRLPGERRRWRKAEADARRVMALAGEVAARSGQDHPTSERTR